MTALFHGTEGPTSVRALLIGDRIQPDAAKLFETVAGGPMLTSVGTGFAVIFKYGAVVLFDVSTDEEQELLERLRPLVRSPLEEMEVEEAHLVVEPEQTPRVRNGVITLPSVSVPAIQVLAEVMARSVALNHYEDVVASQFEQIEPWAEGLAKNKPAPPEAELLRRVGRFLLIQHSMVGRVEVREQPEILWEHVELEQMFKRLVEEYELRDRALALDRKLEQLSLTVSTLVDLQTDKRSIRLEVYIVVLIVVEIVLTLYELFVRGH